MHLVRLIEAYLGHKGMEARAFQRSIGLSAAELARPEARLDLRRYRLARGLVEQVGTLADFDQRPAAGWVGWVAHAWPELASLWFNCPSLGAALQAYARFRPLIGESAGVVCQVDDDRVILQYSPDRGAESSVMSTLSHFMMLREIVDHYGDRIESPVSLRFDMGNLGKPVSQRHLDGLLGASLQVDEGGRAHRLVLRGRGIWEPLSEHQALLHGWSLQALESRLRVLSESSGADLLPRRVEQLIESHWVEARDHASEAGFARLLEEVSQALGMSRWTFRRHLAARGLAFADLVEDVRARLLPGLLADPDLSLLEVSGRLGFASQSAFSRYYRAQRGHPPSHDRRG